jgi:DNA repair protein RadA
LALKVAALKECQKEEFAQLFDELPFAFIKIDAGIAKAALQNYKNRGLPKDPQVAEKIKSAMLAELEARTDALRHGLRTLAAARNFVWDRIEARETRRYEGFVYDFVVPEGHNFIGGNLPTMMHNSQIAHQLSVNVQLPKDKGGLGGKAVFVDTESTFRPERIVDMATAKGIDPQEALKNIYMARAYNSDHQIVLVEKAEEIIKKENIKLIIVDSLTASFRSDYTGRGELASRQQKLNRHLHKLQRLADVYNIAVYITNQVMARPDIMFGDPTAPIGGHVLGHQSTYRVYLRKSKEDKRIAKLIDSPCLPEAETVFRVTKEGITDADEK